MIKPELDLVREGIYGKQAEDLTLENYRICWDSITPNQDFIICPHPHSKNLYIALGGSSMLVLFYAVRCVISFGILTSFVKAGKMYLR